MFRNRNKYRTRSFHDGDWMIKIFPYFFAFCFVIALLWVIVQFAVVGYIGYQVITDPNGAANAVGNIAAEALRPVADAVRGE